MKFKVINIKATSNVDGLIWISNHGLDLSKITYIDCLSNSIYTKESRFGIVIFEQIESNTLRFRMSDVDNHVFSNYSFDVNVLMGYKN